MKRDTFVVTFIATTSVCLLVSLLSVMLCGCASILPGNDVLTVRAQQLRENALTSMKLYLSVEQKNRDLLWKVDHNFKHFADNVRTNSPKWFASLDSSIKFYRREKSLTNQVALVTAMDSLEFAYQEVSTYLGNSTSKISVDQLTKKTP
jgi:hypothetical protein